MKAKEVSLTKNNITVIPIIKVTVVALLSFVFGGTKIFGSISPFATAFTAALPLKFSITSAVGSITGIFVNSTSSYKGFYIAGVLFILAIRLLIARFLKHRIKPAFIFVITFGINSVCALIYNFINNINLIDLILMCIEVMLSACLAYFFAISSNVIISKKGINFSYIEYTSIGILAVSALCGISKYQIQGINFGVLIGVLFIYILTEKLGLIGASVGAIIVSLALNLYTTSMFEFSQMLIISAFISGIFSPMKKAGQVFSFVAVSTFWLLILGAPTTLIYRLIEIFIATAIFIILPQKVTSFLNFLTPIKTNNIGTSFNRSNYESASSRLDFAAQTLSDLKDDLKNISLKFGEIDYNNLNQIYDKTAESVCKGCSLSLDCWDNNYNDISDAFIKSVSVIKSSGELSLDTVPKYLKDRCCKLDHLIKSMNSCYSDFVKKNIQKQQISQSREVVFEQFKAVSDMLYEISNEISSIKNYDPVLTKKLYDTYITYELKPLSVFCYTDSFNRTCAEIYTNNTISTSKEVLCQVISEALDIMFDLPSFVISGSKTKISFFEKAKYDIDFSYQQSCFEDNRICGDSIESFINSNGYAYVILSDGMGNGKRAAIDSLMTCNFMSKLLKAGFGIESSLKLINSSLLLKSTDESSSTVDLAKIDLYTGQMEIIKSGAAPSYLYHSGKIEKLSSKALPIGIMEQVRYDKTSLYLKEDDTIIMLSDGALTLDDDDIRDIVLKASKSSANDMAVKLCNRARDAFSEHKDDITVSVIKLRKSI